MNINFNAIVVSVMLRGAVAALHQGAPGQNDLAGTSTALANDLARRSTALAPPCTLPIALLQSVNRKYK